jgi:hypothetical protein
MYIGYCGKDILFVSKELCSSGKLKVIQLPESMEKLAPDFIMNNYEIWNNRIVSKSEKKDAKELRVAFIGVWGIECGIATYSEWLIPEITKHIKEYKIFAEVNGKEETDPNVTRCWKRGEPVGDLIQKVEEYSPDIVLIQHEYGLYPTAPLWLSLISRLNKFKTFVTMHSVYHHFDKLVCLAPVKNIIVHTNIAKNILTDNLHVPGKISVIPHGSLPVANENKLWNIYYRNRTLMQFGFGFRYKGWEQALQTVKNLKEKYKDIYFTGLFGESPFNRIMHNQYYNELENLVSEYDIIDNVGFVRGYVHDKVLESFLRTNKIAIFPYIENGEHTVYGCSGAARLAMHYNIPVIVSKVPLFDDLEGVCPKIGTIEELCTEIELLFNNPEKVNSQLKKQQEFLIRNSWENVGRMYVDLFTEP